METTINEVEGVKVIQVVGMIESYSASTLETEAEELIGSGSRNIAMNFENVSYIDSSGLGALIRIQKTIARHKGALKFFGVRDTIQKVLRVSGLTSFFTICDTMHNCMQEFRGHSA